MISEIGNSPTSKNMEKAYVEVRGGGYWIADTRISLDSIVYAFKNGAAPETIRRSFPLLKLEEVYGAITFYLAHEGEIEAYLEKGEQAADSIASELNAKARDERPELFERLDRARETVRR
jgi:uncharacterized protein (DUF433 family)